MIGWSKAERGPGPLQLAVGAITNFFDTLGIGSFATTTALFRACEMVPDRIIPGTLNAGHTLPTVAQAFIYTSIIPVDVLTLFAMITAAVLGAWLGAGVVARWSKRKVQIGMGSALLVAAALMLHDAGTWRRFPAGGDGDRRARRRCCVVAVAGNFLLGALMTLGIGLYAPCMILVSLLGMSETTAFPIMMGSCAFLMPVGSLRFIRERGLQPARALGLALGGIPGVLVAAYIVKSLNLITVRWLVIVVVLYTADHDADHRRERKEERRRGCGGPGMRRCAAGLVAGAVIFSLTLCESAAVRAQTAPDGEKAAVTAAVQALFDAMAAKDAQKALSLVIPDGQLQSVRKTDAPAVARGRTLEAFANGLPTQKAPMLERMWNPDVHVSGPIATLAARYDFHLDGKFTHCGTDIFTLVKTADGWKISGGVLPSSRPAASRVRWGSPNRDWGVGARGLGVQGQGSRFRVRSKVQGSKQHRPKSQSLVPSP